VAFSANGKLLASGGLDAKLRLWDVGSGSEVADFPHPYAHMRLLEFDPGGRYLASSNLVCDLPARTVAATLWGSGGRCGCFTPDGSTVLVGTAEGAVRSYSMAEMERARTAAAGPSRAVPAGAVTMNAQAVVVPGGQGDLVWGVTASPDGKWFATAAHDHTVNLWDGQTRKLVRTLRGHSNLVWCVAFSPDSRYLASGSAGPRGGEIRVWEAATGRQVYQCQGHQALVVAVAFHPSQPWLASAGNDGRVLLWDTQSQRDGQLLGEVHHFDQAVHGLAFRPDGCWLAAACHDRSVALWQCREGPPLSRPPERRLTEHDARVWAVAFSPDGKTLASGSEQGTVVLFDGETFERRVALRGAVVQVRGLSFSRDGELLAVAAFTADTLVWNLPRLRHRLAEMGLDW
jgi:WD40 repeat protein